MLRNCSVPFAVVFAVAGWTGAACPAEETGPAASGDPPSAVKDGPRVAAGAEASAAADKAGGRRVPATGDKPGEAAGAPANGDAPPAKPHPLAKWTKKLADAKTPQEIEDARRGLEGWQCALLTPKREVEGAAIHVVASGESVTHVAKKYGTTAAAVMRLNDMAKPSQIAAGARSKVLPGPIEVRVSLAACTLRVFWRSGVLRELPCCVGDASKGCATPVGTYTVVDRVIDPPYTSPEGKVIPGRTPENPIGSRWIKFAPSYGIHGTNEPDSVGKALSKGCVRMRNEDVEWLYDFLPMGSTIVIE